MTLGIFGGTFNPMHLGHLSVARAVRAALALDRVLVTPCAVSPFRVMERATLASDADRLEMARLTIADEPGLEVCDWDLRRGGISYAIDTVNEARAQFPDATVWFMIGADSMAGLPQWFAFDQLVTLCRFAVVARPGTVLPRELPPYVRAVACQPCDISSRAVRAALAENRTIEYLVHPAVEAYIRAHGLYAAREEEKKNEE